MISCFRSAISVVGVLAMVTLVSLSVDFVLLLLFVLHFLLLSVFGGCFNVGGGLGRFFSSVCL